MTLDLTNALFVLFDLPKEKISQEKTVLSFLTPLKEQQFKKNFDGKIFFGRSEMNHVREKARLFYIDLVARIGSTPCNGKTLRQYLDIPNSGNPWWYHSFTAKACEVDQIFNRLLEIYTINHIYQKESSQSIVLNGGSLEVANVLMSSYKVVKKGKFHHDKPFPLRNILSRTKSFLKAIQFHILF